MGSFINSGNLIINSETRTVAIGNEVVDFHPKMTGNNLTNINGKCYIDGYELVNGKWKKTLLATWHNRF